jgi:hypothetical protein
MRTAACRLLRSSARPTPGRRSGDCAAPDAHRGRRMNFTNVDPAAARARRSNKCQVSPVGRSQYCVVQGRGLVHPRPAFDYRTRSSMFSLACSKGPLHPLDPRARHTRRAEPLAPRCTGRPIGPTAGPSRKQSDRMHYPSRFEQLRRAASRLSGHKLCRCSR